MSKWIDIVEGLPNPKTRVFIILTKEKAHIGVIQWYAQWRKYSFFPHPNTVFETDCLKDIISFIDKLMLERKIEKQNSRQ